jgi:hypothetical protein
MTPMTPTLNPAETAARPAPELCPLPLFPLPELVSLPEAEAAIETLVCSASAWKAVKVFEPDVGGLIPKTIPSEQ